MSSSVNYAAPGCIVELMHSGRPLLAWVMEEQSGQLRLMTINKREMKLQASRLLPWLGPAYPGAASRQEIQERLEEHRKLRDGYASGLEMEQIWELAQGEIRQADARWFAELAWPDSDADRIAAMGQALLAQKTLFKFSPPFFEVYSAEQVEQRRLKECEEAALMELTTVGAEIVRKLYEASRQRKVLPPTELSAPGVGAEVAERLKKLLLERIADPDAHDPEGLWKLLVKALPMKNAAEDAHLPLILAVAWGLLPEHYNFWLDRSDYDPGPDWHSQYQERIELVEADVAASLVNLPAAGASLGDGLVSIDPDSTRDWDDAVCVKRLPPDAPENPGGYLALVALACPALAWPFGSELDKAIMRRATSLYLPEGEYFLMPRELALKTFSLQAGCVRPALLVEMEFDAAGAPLSAGPKLAKVNVRANLTQKQGEAALAAPDAGNPATPFAGMLAVALELAEKLKQRRLDNGALITERPDIEVSLSQSAEGVTVSVEKCEPLPNVQTLVGELMIAATFALAQWGGGLGIPLIYRTQDVALPKDFSGVWRREEDIARVLKALPPSLLGLEAKPHAGIGHKLYSSFTAPMRRYPDLINEAQIVSYLQSRKPQFSHADLDALLPQINSRLEAVGQSQRYRPRYWKLLYFQQQEQMAQRSKSLKYWDAVITDENTHYVSIMLDAAQLYLRGPRSLFGERALPGTRVSVRLGKINPLRNEIQIMEVLQQ